MPHCSCNNFRLRYHEDQVAGLDQFSTRTRGDIVRGSAGPIISQEAEADELVLVLLEYKVFNRVTLLSSETAVFCSRFVESYYPLHGS